VAVLRSGPVENGCRHRHRRPDLPRVLGFVGELNQIWANLIDNALDAVPTPAAST
jgi:signal transduction histidine kinase